MINNKQLIRLGIVFAALFIVYLVTLPRQTGVNVEDLVQNIVIGVSEDDIAQIEVYKETAGGQATLQLARVEDAWRVPTHFNARGNTSKIEKLVTDIIEMTGNVRSTDPGHIETYGISDVDGLHLNLKDETGKPLANLIIGKRAEDYNSGFIRYAGKDKVYAVDKNLLSSLSIYGDVDTLTVLKQSGWVDLQAIDKKKDDYELAGIVSNNREMVIKKVEREKEETIDDSTVIKTVTEWVLLKGNDEIDLDQKAVDDFWRDAGKIRGTEVVDRIGNSLADMDKGSRYGTGMSRSYIVFQKADGTREVVLFGKEYEKDKGYYMNTQEDGLIYKVSKANFDKAMKWFKDLPEKTI